MTELDKLVIKEIKRQLNESGGNIIVDAYDKVKHIIFNTGSPKTDKILKKYGKFYIKNMMIHRKPVEKALQTIVNLISLGKFNDYKYEYDDLFHLALVIEVSRGNKTVFLLTEKTPSIDWKVVRHIDDFDSKGDTMSIPVDDRSYINLGDLMEKTKQIMGPDFNTYNGKTNNCQNYILSIVQAFYDLEKKNSLTQNIKDFIYQDVKPYISDGVSEIMNKVTDLGGLKDRLLGSSTSKKLLKKK